MHFNACYSGQIRNVCMPPTQASHCSVSVQTEGHVEAGRENDQTLSSRALCLSRGP